MSTTKQLAVPNLEILKHLTMSLMYLVLGFILTYILAVLNHFEQLINLLILCV